MDRLKAWVTKKNHIGIFYLKSNMDRLKVCLLVVMIVTLCYLKSNIDRLKAEKNGNLIIEKC